MATFASRLRDLRLQKGLTQEQLSDALGIGRSALAMYESGQRIPRYKTIDTIADYFGVTTDYLRGKTNFPHGVILIEEQQQKMFEGVKKQGEKDGMKIPNGINNLADLSNWMEMERMRSVIKSQHAALDHLARSNEQPIIGQTSVRIPIIGQIVAGQPIDSVENYDGWEEIPSSLAKTGTFFALRVHGQSMEPTMREGDIVIVRQQPNVESGDIAVVCINGTETTVKEVKESQEGITLIGHNLAVYKPQFYSNEQIQALPVVIQGKVVELHRKF